MTGAGGFLGGYAARALEAAGWQVVRAGRPHHDIPSPTFDDLLDQTHPELVVHCAGPASVPASLVDPARDFHGSVDVLFALLERLRGRGTTLVLLSSAAVYGDPDRLPVTEDAPLRPVSPYGFHRVECELLLREHHELWGLRCCALRVFSAYGEGLRRQLLWDICTRALADGVVELEGTGRESRDFVHAQDVARAVVVAAREAPLQGEAYNVGTGRETTLEELASLLLAALGTEAAVTFSGSVRRGDPRNWRADVQAIADLGFEPSVALEDGVRRYARWARRELGA